MDKQEFIKQFSTASSVLDMLHIDQIISDCIDRFHDERPEYESGHMNLIATMEECAELIEAISRRMRGRTKDSFGVVEEMADVIISIWCIAQILNIPHKDIRKAINVKMDLEAGRIAEHKTKTNM